MRKRFVVETGFDEHAFDCLKDANERFLSIARSRIETYVRKRGCEDWGYLDLHVWISVRDADSDRRIEYWMPCINKEVQNLIEATPETLYKRVEFLKFKTRGPKIT